MKLTIFLFSALTATGLSARAQPAGEPVRSALPPHAKLLQSEAIVGSPGRTVVVYGLSGNHIGIVASNGPASHLIWSRSLHFSSPRLVKPGPQHVFAATGITAENHVLVVFALHGSTVQSAVSGNSNATVTGDEGVRVSPDQFTVRNRDLTHVGSAHYRLVSTYQWTGNTYKFVRRTRAPDYAAGQYPVPNGTIHTKSGDVLLLNLEVANTESMREYGLMNRKSLDPDRGMVFVWPQPVQESFWMQNTYIPLSVAFLDSSGRILEILDMEPLTTTLHTPTMAYSYAVEVNRGYFTANGVSTGDVVQLHL